MQRISGTYTVLCVCTAFFFLTTVHAARGDENGQRWITAQKMEPTGYDLSDFLEDPDIVFRFRDKVFTLPDPAVRRGTEIWAPLRDILKEMGIILMPLDNESVNFIDFSGGLFKLELGTKEVTLNKKPFGEIPKPLAKRDDLFMIEMESLSRLLDLDYSYDPDLNEIGLGERREEGFSTFTLVKPARPEPAEDDARYAEAVARPVSMLPSGIKEESLPDEYRRDVDMRLDTHWQYFADMFDEKRVRYNEYYLTGRAYDVEIYGNLLAKDRQTTGKSRFREDRQKLNFFKEGTGLRLLDNFISLPALRNQSQGFWGIEVIDLESPLTNRNVFRLGRLDPVTVTGLEGKGSFRVFGDVISIEQEWRDNDTLDLTTMVGYVSHYPEFKPDRGDSTQPRENMFYVIDSLWHIRSDVDLLNTIAQCIYSRDDKNRVITSDIDYKTGFKVNNDRFSIGTYAEYVGDEYASLNLPETYQDYLGGDIVSRYTFSDYWAMTFSTTFNKNNVKKIDENQTTYGRTFTLGNSFQLPWRQNLNVTWTYNSTVTKGGGRDTTGNEYGNWMLDYYKQFDTLGIQLGYQYFRVDPLGETTGSNFYHFFSGSLYKYFPALNGSYIRLYQDITKRKQLSSGNVPTTTTWVTSLSGRLYILKTFNVNADCRLRTTERDDQESTSIMTLRCGTGIKVGPETLFNFTYTLNDVDFFDKYRTTKNYSLMFTLNHTFDVVTPEKWGKVRAQVYDDINDNGAPDAGEGLEDVLVYVIDGRYDRTDSRGTALIRKVAPGARSVTMDMRRLPVDMLPKGGKTQEVVVEPLKTAHVVFPLVRTASLKGRVFADLNGNGSYEMVQDIPLANVRVFLGPDGPDTLTFSDGSYLLDSVYPGTYTIGIDALTVSEQYIIDSPAKRDVSLQRGDSVEGEDFILKQKAIDVHYFD